MEAKHRPANRPHFELRPVPPGEAEIQLHVLDDGSPGSPGKPLSRRDFLRLCALGGMTALAAACGVSSAAETASTPTPAPTAAPTPVSLPTPAPTPLPDYAPYCYPEALAHRGQLTGVAFSPDSKLLVSGCAGSELGDVLKIWDMNSGMLVNAVNSKFDVNSVAFSPDGKIFASGNNDNTIQLWQADGGQPFKTLEGHTAGVQAIAFSPDSKYLASESADGSLRLWDLSSGQALLTLQGHTLPECSLAFTPDGKTLVSAGVDKSGDSFTEGAGIIRLWEIPGGRLLKTLEIGPVQYYSFPAALSPDGKFLACGIAGVSLEDSRIQVWDVAGGQLLRTWLSEQVNSLAFSPDGKFLASGGMIVNIWEFATSLPVKTLGQGLNMGSEVMPFPSRTEAIAYSPDGNLLALGGDKLILVWNAKNFNPAFTSCLFDPAASDAAAVAYRVTDEFGITRTYTVPSTWLNNGEIPPDAVCICHAVGGTYVYSGSSGGGSYCSCNSVCVCMSV